MDEDILALVSDEVHQPEKLWDVLDLQVRPLPVVMTFCGYGCKPVRLSDLRALSCFHLCTVMLL